MKRKTIKISIAIMAFAVIATLVTATILTSYGVVQTTATVGQAIVFDGMEDSTPVEHEIETFGGCTICIKEKIVNRACIEGVVDFQTTYSPDGDGITTTIYQVPDTTTLALNNKDEFWVEIDGDGIEGELVFGTMETEFDYELNAVGLAVDTGYSLIYYADPWTGNNPGLLIDAFISDGTGTISVAGSVDLGMNLPQPEDDNYLLGAKLWLVLSSDYDETASSMIAWNPDDYLFEHNLIAYSDCNIHVDCHLAQLLGHPIVDEFFIPAQTTIGLIFCYDFAINIAPGIYIISTEAIPVV